MLQTIFFLMILIGVILSVINDNIQAKNQMILKETLENNEKRVALKLAMKRKRFEDFKEHIESSYQVHEVLSDGDNIDIKEIDDIDNVVYTSPTVLKEFLNHNIRFQLQDLSVADVISAFY